jgi:hypothetical protein
VQCYAHLSPDHLREAVEGVFSFGQSREIPTGTEIANKDEHEEKKTV